jgi:hypothetical protein
MPAEGLRGGFQADQRRPIMKSHRVAGVLARRGPRTAIQVRQVETSPVERQVQSSASCTTLRADKRPLRPRHGLKNPRKYLDYYRRVVFSMKPPTAKTPKTLESK